MKTRTRSLSTVACMVLLTAALTIGGNAASGQEQSGPLLDLHPPASGLSDLLDRAGFDYKVEKTPGGDDQYRIVVTSDDGSSVVVARELTMKWQHKDGLPVRVVYLYCQVVPFPDAFIPSAALLKLLATKNNDLIFGNVGIGKYGVFYSNSLWLNQADAETLTDTLQLAHATSTEFRKDCQPFVKQAE